MEWIKENVSYKHFNPQSFVLVSGYVVTQSILCGIFINIETQQQSNFRCVIKSKEKEYIQGLCFEGYQDETTKGFPNYAFVLLNFLFVIMVCIWYSLPLKPRIQALESEDIERGTFISSCRLYRRYCIQLTVRFTWGILFLILQWGAFYPMNFPSKYVCEFSQLNPQNSINSTSNVSGRLSYDCHNPEANKKTLWSIMVFAVNVVVTVLVLAELVYILGNGKINKNFKKDSIFFQQHLLNQPLKKIIEDYVTRMKDNVKKYTQQQFGPLLPNLHNEDKNLFDKILPTNLIIHVCSGRAIHEFNGGGHEGYLKTEEKYESINKLEDIFTPKKDNPSEVPHSIIIVGRPGIGKSLMCQKILRDWACGEILSSRELEPETRKVFELVYLFRFRFFDSNEKLNLKQLFGKCEFAGALPTGVFHHIVNDPKSVLIVFDGLNEFVHKERIAEEEKYGNSIAETVPFSALYAKLIKGKLLEGATVITTSRPTALSYVSNINFDQRLEILGFNSKQIEEYIDNFFQRNKNEIWNHISTNTNLLSLCYVPVNCSIICQTLQEKLKCDDIDADSLTFTFTNVYEEALMHVICNHHPEYTNNPSKQCELRSSRKFTSEVETYLKRLGEIAYTGIEKGKLIFESNEVKGYEDSALLYRVAATTKKRLQYCFLHPTLQEFLAAWYKVNSEGNLKALQIWISVHLRHGKWEVVIKFVAGLLHDEDNSIIKLFIHLLPRPVSRWPNSLNSGEMLRILHCIFNISRNSENECKSLISETLHGVVNLNLRGMSLTNADLTPIIFVLQELENVVSLDISLNNIGPSGCLEVCKLLMLSHTHPTNKCKLSTLNIGHNSIGDDGLKHLSDALSTNDCKLTTLNIGYNNIGDDGIKHLSDALSTNECKLTALNIGYNNISDDGIKHLSDALSTNECKLTTLNIGYNNIGDDGVKHLSEALSTNECKLTTLDISDNQIGPEGIKHLSKAPYKFALTKLDIGFNQIKDDGLIYLSQLIYYSTECKLTTLDISGNQVSDAGLQYFSKCVLVINAFKLTTLHISDNQISNDGLKDLSNALCTNECKLSTLNIGYNDIGDDGIEYLSDALSTNECKLTTLNIGYNNIGDDGIKHLSDALSTNECKLTTLNIIGNRIMDSGLQHLCYALSKNDCKLTTLEIGDNDICDDGFKHLCDALSTNECKLTTLKIIGNRMNDTGLKQLSFALSTNECKLTTLDIGDTDISVYGVQHLCNALSTDQCKLTMLEVSRNGIGDGLMHLFDVLHTNESNLTTLNIRNDDGVVSVCVDKKEWEQTTVWHQEENHTLE